MSLEISPDEPIVPVMSEATADIGRPGRLSGLDSWYDGATFTRLGGIPAIAYGPPGFAPDGRSVAHTIDEYVPVDGLVSCAQGLAVAAMRFCGVARDGRSRAASGDPRPQGARPARFLEKEVYPGGGSGSPSAARSTEPRSPSFPASPVQPASRI